MKLRFISCRKAIHDRRSIHGVANSFLPLLLGNSPVRGDVCNADKGVPVSGGKGGPRSGG